MSRPSAAQRKLARQLLVHEGAAGGSDELAMAAGRAYVRLHAHLDPLLGAAGVRALFARSARLILRDFPFLEADVLEDSTRLSECLRAQEPTVALEAAVALLATFFALITTFIGERLTTQALRVAWPALEETAPEGTKE